MDASVTFVYGGALHGTEAAFVVRPRAGDGVVTTDGPFVESKERWKWSVAAQRVPQISQKSHDL